MLTGSNLGSPARGGPLTAARCSPRSGLGNREAFDPWYGFGSEGRTGGARAILPIVAQKKERQKFKIGSLPRRPTVGEVAAKYNLTRKDVTQVLTWTFNA